MVLVRAAAAGVGELLVGDSFKFCLTVRANHRSLVCRKNTTDASGVVNAPDEKGTFMMWIENLSDAWLNHDPAFRSLPGRVQGSFNGEFVGIVTMYMAVRLTAAGMINFNRSPPGPNDTGIRKTHLPNAIHYRRGVRSAIPRLRCPHH